MGAALACNAANMLVRRGHYERCAAVLADLLDGRTVQGQGLHLHIERAELQLRMGDPAGARASLAAAAPLRGGRRAGRRRRGRRRRPRSCSPRKATATAACAPSRRRSARLAGTQDRRFRTELLVIGLRNEAERAGRCPAAPDSAAAARLDRLAAELERPGAAGGRRRRPRRAPPDGAERAGRARGTGDRRRTGRRRCELWRTAERPREEAYCLLRAGRVPRRRQAAGQGGGRGDGRPRHRRAARRAARSSRRSTRCSRRTRLSVAPGAADAGRGPALRTDRAGVRGARPARAPVRPTGRSPGNCSSAIARWVFTCPAFCISSRSRTGRRPQPSR